MEEKLRCLNQELVALKPYDSHWPVLFELEREHLKSILPPAVVKRIEHFGSTAVPGLSAKPIVDVLVEVSSLEETKKQIVPILEREGYEYFWRPTIGNAPPFYAWFIRRGASGERTHHIHMVEADSELWDRLLFRDYLREFSEEAHRYSELKERLSREYPHDRTAYTVGKTEYIVSTTRKAKLYYRRSTELS